MIYFDSKKGTHFTNKRIRVTAHARSAAEDDFRIPKYEADEWIKDQLVQSQFIGMIYGENNEPVRLFGHQRIAFILSPNDDVVITIYARHHVDASIRHPLEEVVRTASENGKTRLARTEAQAKKTIERLQEIVSTFGTYVQSDAPELQVLRDEIHRQEQIIYDARQEHARLMKGIVAYV